MLRAVQTVGKTPTETFCFKATFKDNERPKEKHVKALIDIANQENNVQWSAASRHKSIVDVLEERLQEKSWEVALKTLIVIHRLMRDANSTFSKQLYPRSDILNLSSFLDKSSTMSWGQSKFVNQYAAFLFEKIFCYHQIGFFVEKRIAVEGAKFIKDLSFTRLQNFVPFIERLFGRLLECELYTSEGMHPISSNAYIQLIKDAFRVQSVASVCVLNMLEAFKNSGLEQARWTLTTYKSFLEQNKKFMKWIDRAVKTNIVDKELVPANSFPQTLADSLQAYVRQLEKHPEKRPSAKWEKDPPEVGNLRDLLKDEDVELNLREADDSEDDFVSSPKNKKSRRRSTRARTRSRNDSASSHSRSAASSPRTGRGRGGRKTAAAATTASAAAPKIDKPRKRSRSSKAGQRRRSRTGSTSGASHHQQQHRGPFGGSGGDRRSLRAPPYDQPVSLLDDSPAQASSSNTGNDSGDPIDALAMYFASSTTVSTPAPVFSHQSHNNDNTTNGNRNGVSPFDEMDDLFDFSSNSSQPQAFVEAKPIPNPFDDLPASSNNGAQQQTQKSMSGQVAKRVVNTKNTRKNAQSTPFDDLVSF